MHTIKNKIYMLKLSGESLRSYDKGEIIDPARLAHHAQEITEAYQAGYQLVIVIGGGNIWRGKEAKKLQLTSHTSDYMGMIATIMNAYALQEALQARQIPVYLTSKFMITGITTYQIECVQEALAQKKIIILAGGTGIPFFTTDSAAVLAALELGACKMLKGTKVDGIYEKDPVKFPYAKRYTTITFTEAKAKELQVMDATAFVLAEKHQLPLLVYNAQKAGNLLKALSIGTKIGTEVTSAY